jgi:ABC-type polysaccharide/polyol phosphate export permease
MTDTTLGHTPADALSERRLDPSAPDVRVIRPAKRRIPLSDLWRSRYVAWIVALRDLRIKYKQSVLGPAWLVLQPLGILAGLVLVFDGVTTVNTGDVPYVLFALVGMGVWTFVQQSLTAGSMAFVLNSELIRRVASPRVAFVTASVISNLVAPSLIIVASIVGVWIAGRSLPLQVLALPLFAAWLIVLMTGVLFLLASLTARFRDVFSLIPFWSQAGLFLTPVGYPLASATPTLETILSLNPLTGILELWRWSLFGTDVGTFPIISAVAWTLVLVVSGWRVFTRMEVSLVDHI